MAIRPIEDDLTLWAGDHASMLLMPRRYIICYKQGRCIKVHEMKPLAKRNEMFPYKRSYDGIARYIVLDGQKIPMRDVQPVDFDVSFSRQNKRKGYHDYEDATVYWVKDTDYYLIQAEDDTAPNEKTNFFVFKHISKEY